MLRIIHSGAPTLSLPLDASKFDDRDDADMTLEDEYFQNLRAGRIVKMTAGHVERAVTGDPAIGVLVEDAGGRNWRNKHPFAARRIGVVPFNVGLTIEVDTDAYLVAAGATYNGGQILTTGSGTAAGLFVSTAVGAGTNTYTAGAVSATYGSNVGGAAVGIVEVIPSREQDSTLDRWYRGVGQDSEDVNGAIIRIIILGTGALPVPVA